MSKADRLPLIADLRAMGYSAADIARALGCTRAHVSQALQSMGMAPKRMRMEDLPQDLRDRIARAVQT